MTEYKSDTEKLNAALDLINEMKEQLLQLGEAGLEQVTVLDTYGKYALLSSGTYALNKDYQVGQNVLIYPRTGQVYEILDYNPLVGELYVIAKVTEQWAEVTIGDKKRLISKGKFLGIKAGDVVLLDNYHTIVRAIIDMPKPPVKITTPVTWDEIGGNEEAKQHLHEAIVLPYQHPKLYKGYGQRHTKGILL